MLKPFCPSQTLSAFELSALTGVAVTGPTVTLGPVRTLAAGVAVLCMTPTPFDAPPQPQPSLPPRGAF